jgi:alanine racemase
MAWAQINLSYLRSNIKEIKARAEGSALAPVIKCDAYGHGALQVSKAIERDVSMLLVARLSEARELAQGGIKAPILILEPLVEPLEVREALKSGFRLSVAHREGLELVREAGKKLSLECRIHLEVDTGMTRTGIDPASVQQVLAQIMTAPYLRLEGVFTHFATSDSDREVALGQKERFEEALSHIPEVLGFYSRHAANSGAILNLSNSLYDMVRPGITVYGLHPSENMENELPLRPVLSFKAKVLQVRTVKKGTGISYMHTFKAPHDMRIATINVGYGDGYPRHLSNKGEVLIRGKRAEIVGVVTMDLTMVDVTHIKNVGVGDTVTLIGRDGDDEITAQDLANISETINYEIITRVGNSVPRVHVSEAEARPLLLFPPS